MEVFPKPFGLTAGTESASSSFAQVAMAGTANAVYNSLQLGSVYYSTTSGGLVTGTSLYGREECAADGLWYDYVYDPDLDIIVTSSSKIGVAVSTSAIFVSTI